MKRDHRPFTEKVGGFVCFSFIIVVAVLLMGFKSVPTSHILEYGLYKKINDGDPVQLQNSYDGDYLYTAEFSHLKTTDIIPAELDTYFGFTYELVDLPPGETVKLDIWLNHPPMKQPDGSTVTKSSYWQQITVSPEGKYASAEHFGFNHEYELVTGKWAFQYYLGQQLLLEKTFAVENGSSVSVKGEFVQADLNPSSFFVVGATVSPPMGVGFEWSYDAVSESRVEFAAKGNKPTLTFAANIVTHGLPDVVNDRELLEHVIEGRGVSGGHPRYETIINKELLSYEKGTVCVRYHAKFKDFDAANLPKDQSFLVMEDFGSICRHPENPNVGIAIGISQRSLPNDIYEDFEEMAEKYIASGSFEPMQQ